MRANIVLAVMIALGGVGFFGSIARAESASNRLSDAQLVSIRTNCSQIKTQLDRVHSTDALLRVNRGQLYEHMGTRLMTPLNTRIAANRLDGSSLIAVTSQYESHLEEFRTSYRDYERKLSETLRVDCQKQPANFYDLLSEARTLRTKVFDATERLREDVASYAKGFDAFANTQKKSGEE